MDQITNSLLDSFAKKQSLQTSDQSKLFEFFVNYSILSRYNNNLNLDSFDTENTMGIDGAAILINNQFVFSPEEASDIIQRCNYFTSEFIFISSKMPSSFDNSYISNLFVGIYDIFSSNAKHINANSYIKDIVEIKNIILDNASKMENNPKLIAYLCTTGIWNSGDSVLKNVVETNKKSLENLGLFSDISFTPLGRSEIQQLYRKADRSLKAIFKLENQISLPDMKYIDSAYIAVVTAKEFLKILEISSDKINENIFYENVRDYQEDNSDANKSMKDTLRNSQKNDKFCLYNNGITLLAQSGSMSGQNITLDDYQIVNGCQTSNVIFDISRTDDISDVLIPLKIVITKDENVREDIIRSTNTQKAVSIEQFLSLTQFSKNLEEFFKSFGNKSLFYERRNGQYRNQDVNALKIIDQKTLIKISGTVLLDLPDEAGRYPISFLKAHPNELFQSSQLLDPYYFGAYMYYKILEHLRKISASRKYKNLIFYILIILRYKISKEKLQQSSARAARELFTKITNILEDDQKLEELIKEAIATLEQCCNLDEIDRATYSSKKFREHILKIVKDGESVKKYQIV